MGSHLAAGSFSQRLQVGCVAPLLPWLLLSRCTALHLGETHLYCSLSWGTLGLLCCAPMMHWVASCLLELSFPFLKIRDDDTLSGCSL